MHPPFSIIFMTTLFGLGQGMFLALYTGQVYSLLNLLPPQDSPHFYGVGSGIALLLLMAGLVASIFHLGHPERAYMAIRQWRTSWLSREVLVVPVLMGLVVLYGGLHYLDWTPPLISIADGVDVDLTFVIGAMAAVSCFALFLCTGMIYASVRFLKEWATPLTVINFVLFGGASGFTLATAFAMSAAPELVGFFGAWAIILILLAFAGRGASLVRNRRLKSTSSLRSAIGVRHERIRQLHQGAMGGSFNTREFFHGKPDQIVRMVRWGFLLLTFPLPIFILALGLMAESTGLLLAAAIIQYLGLLCERWFFFAEARHPQNLYYQSA